MVFWVDVLFRLERQSRFCMHLLEALHVALLLLDYRVISPFLVPVVLAIGDPGGSCCIIWAVRGGAGVGLRDREAG